MQRYFALALAFTAFFLTAYLSRTVFERLPHLEDELAYLYQARVFAGGQIVAETPDPRTPFWQPFVVDYEGNRFSKYTPGWSLILAVGVLLGAPWWINATLSALTIALVYRLGEEIFSPDVGLIAALLTTCSPIFLLLGSSLMGHTAALFCTMLFAYAYWRLERGRNRVMWGLVAGLALGTLVVNRPLTSIGVALPFVLYSLLRLLYALVAERHTLWRTLEPLIVLGLAALVLLPVIPIYRYAATGDPLLNPYLLVWEYDKVGFGEGYGRYDHTLERGLRHTREDLSLTASDMFGWQTTPLTYQQREHLLTGTRTYPGTGLSWLLLPFGLVVGLLWRRNGRPRWTLLLVAIPAAVIGVHLAYWIGSQRYSTRYYFEGLAAAALISALLPCWIATWTRWTRPLVYAVLIAVTGYSFFAYTLPRVRLMYGFNHVTQVRLDEINAHRQTDQPALVILSGNGMTWRANGTLMGVTDPWLAGDVILARDTATGRYREQLIEMFPEREVIELRGLRSKHWYTVWR